MRCMNEVGFSLANLRIETIGQWYRIRPRINGSATNLAIMCDVLCTNIRSISEIEFFSVFGIVWRYLIVLVDLFLLD